MPVLAPEWDSVALKVHTFVDTWATRLANGGSTSSLVEDYCKASGGGKT